MSNSAYHVIPASQLPGKACSESFLADNGSALDAAADAFETHGVVCLREVLNENAVERLRDAAERSAAAPGPLGYKIGTPGQPGFFYYDFQMHQRLEAFRWFVEDSPVKDYAARLMRSRTVTLYYSNMFIKDSGCEAPTPWHEDATYGRMHGVMHVINFWVALDPISCETALLFKQGSHRRPGRIYRAYHFEEGKRYDAPVIDSDRVQMPAFDALDRAFPTVWWTLKAGDALIFTQRTLHGAPGNPTPDRRRTANMLLLGDNATYNAAAGEADPPFKDPELKEGDHPAGDVFRRIR